MVEGLIFVSSNMSQLTTKLALRILIQPQNFKNSFEHYENILDQKGKKLTYTMFTPIQ